MAVEVKEIIIRAVLEEDRKHHVSRTQEMDKGALVRETVQEVLKILKKRNKR